MDNAGKYVGVTKDETKNIQIFLVNSHNFPNADWVNTLFKTFYTAIS